MKRFLKYDTEITKKENSPVDKSGVIKENIGGGSSVQPDWNQNDSTQPDYVKNRPFYTDNPVETVLVEEQTVAFSDMNGVYSVQGWPTEFDAVVGATYTVSWDGTEYECECLIKGSLPYIGNLAVAGGEIDTGEPFIFMNQGAWVVATNDTASEHIIEISSIAKQIVKIDEKYLPIATSNNAGIGTKDVIHIDGIYTEAELKNLISYWQKHKYDKIFLYSNECHTVASMGLSNGTFNCRLSKYNFSVVPNDDGLYDLKNETRDYNWCSASEFHLIRDGADIGISKDTFRNLPKNSIVALKINSNVEVEDLYVKDKLYIKQINNTRDLCIYMDTDGLIRVKYGSNANTSAIWNKTMFLNSDKELILTSSTEGSTKKFKITVDDSGAITATEVS